MPVRSTDQLIASQFGASKKEPTHLPLIRGWMATRWAIHFHYYQQHIPFTQGNVLLTNYYFTPAADRRVILHQVMIGLCKRSFSPKSQTSPMWSSHINPWHISRSFSWIAPLNTALKIRQQSKPSPEMRVKHRTEEYNLAGVTLNILQGRARLKGDYSNMDSGCQPSTSGNGYNHDYLHEITFGYFLHRIWLICKHNIHSEMLCRNITKAVQIN